MLRAYHVFLSYLALALIWLSPHPLASTPTMPYITVNGSRRIWGNHGTWAWNWGHGAAPSDCSRGSVGRRKCTAPADMLTPQGICLISTRIPSILIGGITIQKVKLGQMVGWNHAQPQLLISPFNSTLAFQYSSSNT